MPHSSVVNRLKELIAALDSRHVQPGRAAEARIAKDALEMRGLAVSRLAALENDPGPGDV